MTATEALALRAGDRVQLLWPGSNSGADCKLAQVVRVNKAGTKVGVLVAQTTPGGRYTGGFGRSVRWFPADEVLDTETP